MHLRFFISTFCKGDSSLNLLIMIDYISADTPLSQVKLNELGAWFSRRNKSPQAMVQAMSRGLCYYSLFRLIFGFSFVFFDDATEQFQHGGDINTSTFSQSVIPWLQFTKFW